MVLQEAQKSAVEVEALARSTAEEATRLSDEAKVVLEEAVARFEGSSTALAALREQLEEVTKKLNAEEKLQGEAKAQLTKFDEALADIKEEAQEAHKIFDDHFASLRDGTCEAASFQKIAFESVEAFLRAHKAEPSMMAAVPSALTKAIADRGDFDVFVVSEVQALLEKWVTLADERVQKASQEQEEANAEWLGAWAVTDLANQTVSSLTSWLSKQEKEESLAKAHKGEAEADFKLKETQMTETADALTAAVSEVQKYADAIAAVQQQEEEPANPSSEAAVADVSEAAVADVPMEVAAPVADVEMQEEAPVVQVSVDAVMKEATPVKAAPEAEKAIGDAEMGSLGA